MIRVWISWVGGVRSARAGWGVGGWVGVESRRPQMILTISIGLEGVRLGKAKRAGPRRLARDKKTSDGNSHGGRKGREG